VECVQKKTTLQPLPRPVPRPIPKKHVKHTTPKLALPVNPPLKQTMNCTGDSCLVDFFKNAHGTYIARSRVMSSGVQVGNIRLYFMKPWLYILNSYLQNTDTVDINRYFDDICQVDCHCLQGYSFCDQTVGRCACRDGFMINEGICVPQSGFF